MMRVVSVGRQAGDMGRTGHDQGSTHGPGLASQPGVFTAQFILFATVLAQLADALSFTIGVGRFGIGLESNPYAVALHGSSGLDAVLLAKLAAILFAIALLVVAANRYPRLLVWGGATATSLGLLGFVTNTWSMAILGG
jgi:hypothetical protein